MHVLVTGGAGFVGSNVVAVLRQAGHSVSVVDDLTSGHRAALPSDVELVVGRCGDHAVLNSLSGLPDGVMHLAAKCSVVESMQDPRAYYETNVGDSLSLLAWIADRGIGWIVHSSTCSVYGRPERLPIEESTPTLPINAYGASKLAVDEAIGFYAGAYPMRGTVLRYFNAAGAGAGGQLGEDKSPATNLVPRVLAVALGQRSHLDVYGHEFDTVDGTGVRDYVHVTDLAVAHVAALDSLAEGAGGDVYNLGTGEGASVLQVAEAARRVTGHDIPVRLAAARPGDPPALVAAAGRAREVLGWRPQRSDLDTILGDAWAWHERHPRGYADSDVDHSRREPADSSP